MELEARMDRPINGQTEQPTHQLKGLKPFIVAENLFEQRPKQKTKTELRTEEEAAEEE